MNRIPIGIACITASLVLGSGCTRDETAGDPQSTAPANAALPNVLLISIDTLRADHLGSYGYPRATSPRIDRLASQGALFETVVSSTSWTLPAHAAMFTGLVDSVHGCTDTDRPLDPSRTTLAERLSETGRSTAGFFSGPYLHPVFGLSQGFETWVDCTSYAQFNDARAEATGTIEGPDVWLASQQDVTNPQVYAEVERWLRKNSEQPFFLFVHLWDVHFDFVPPAPFDEMFDPDYAGTVTGRNFFFDPAVAADMPQRDLEHLIALYDGEIAWTDSYVGRILDDLDSLGLSEDTVVVLTADHGTAFFEHGLKAHRNALYDELIRIPLIVRFPGRVAAGLRIEDQVRLIDVAPTILELLGIPVPDEVMGQSLVPLLQGRPLPRDEPALSQLLAGGQTLHAYRRREHKLIVEQSSERGVVFNLRDDPAEQDPLVDFSVPIARAALRDRASTQRTAARYRRALPRSASASEIPPEVMQALEGLGYIETAEQE